MKLDQPGSYTVRDGKTVRKKSFNKGRSYIGDRLLAEIRAPYVRVIQ